MDWKILTEYVMPIVLLLPSPSLRLVKSDHLPSLGRSSHVVVEATLYHGDRPLCPTVTTVTHTLGQTVRWKSTLNFKIKKKNIPKVYKISSPNSFIKSTHLGSIGLPKLTQLQRLQFEFTQMWYSGMWLVRPNLQSDWSPKCCIVLVCDPCMCTQPWYVTLVRYYAQPLA